MLNDGSYNYSLVGAPVTGKNKIEMDEMGASLWMDWQSGYLNDMFGVQLGYQSAAPNLYNNGYVEAQNSMVPGITVKSDYARYYEATPDSAVVGKVSNANLQMRLGDDENYTKLSVGRFTPTIYNLLHRPDYIYYATHEVYEGASLTGELNWSWGMIQPWFNYFTGYSNCHTTGTVRFKDDLKEGVGSGYFDKIYNVGYHTETDYFTSSASYSVAPDYQKNGLVEVYTGIPLSYLAGNPDGDRSKILKFLIKYGMEEGTGKLNSDHKTDVVEYGIGIDTGDFDLLAGVTKIGKESFRGFETQDGYKAGGGTAVWGDLAVFNKFDRANQTTYFLFGGYNLDNVGFQKWRIQGVAAMATDTDRSKMSVVEQALVAKEDYTEINLELAYNYRGEGLGYRFMVGTDTNMKVSGFGLFIEYNTDILK
ncbi:hypothetical protein [Endozoicomonas euniceicola]|uniref:Porin domain-containing protein n=1 Tax=Endozoicomonas euniceicola TaxID=1234143 RepID=A0ABY6GTD7_9GAMM|nr:hypothetical protein [Endozoicomonas euniceicola]UYM15827.1 hypothetical protein NX720_23880 [Endozoicomonas euniceicola]